MSTANDANMIGARKDVVKESQGPFSNPAMVANYADETPRKVPGLADLHRMAMLLLSERAQQAAHILVIGAGGGMELKAMAEAQRKWVFTGVDPSAAMLDLGAPQYRAVQRSDRADRRYRRCGTVRFV